MNGLTKPYLVTMYTVFNWYYVFIQKVTGLPRKRNYAGRWDVLIDKSTKCLNKLLEVAAEENENRNYIIDQVHVITGGCNL